MAIAQRAPASSPVGKPSNRMTLLCSAFCSLGLFLLLAWPLFQGKVYVYDDLGNQHLPWRYFYSQALAAGDSFLWSPAFHCGLSLHGEGQVGMYHPLHLLLYSLLPLTTAFNLELLINYALLFSGMTWMLGRWGLPRHACLTGAMIFTFCGFNLMHYMHLNAVAIVAHIPWLIGSADFLFSARTKRERGAAQAAVSLLTGSQLLLGYPQYFWLSNISELSFVLWKLHQGGNGRKAGWWLLAKLTGGMLGMIQLLPTWESLKGSIRSAPSLDFRLSYSLHPMNLLQLWSPFSLSGHIYGGNAHELALYSGSFATVALAWPWVRRDEPGQWKALSRASLAFAGIMLWLALGRYGLLYTLLAHWPPFNIFRVPARHMVLLHLSMSILAAIAVAELAALPQRRERIPWKALWPLAIPAALSLATATVAVFVLGEPGHIPRPALFLPNTYSTISRTEAGTFLILMATALTALAARGFRWSVPALVVLTAVDAFAWGMDYIRSLPPQSIETFVQSVPEPPDSTGRIFFPDNPFRSNVLTMKGYRLANGYMALEPAKKLDPNSPLYQRLAGVRWVAEDGRWKKVADPMPRARMIARVVAPPAPDDTNRIAISNAAWVEPKVDIVPGKPGSARLVLDRPGWIDIRTSTPSRQLLILSESYHPGWQATQDGHPVQVVRAYGDFMACPIDPGSHRIEFQFNPASFRRGVWLSITGLGLLAGSIAWLLLA